MKLLEAVLARLGYVKLQNYGLTLTADGHVVPLPETAGWQSRDGYSLPLPAEPDAPGAGRHRLRTARSTGPQRALPEVSAVAATGPWSSQPRQALKAVEEPPLPIAPMTLESSPAKKQTEESFANTSVRDEGSNRHPAAAAHSADRSGDAPVAPSSSAVQASEDQDDEEAEWEQRLAAARARARNDDTATVPQSGQAASVAAPSAGATANAAGASLGSDASDDASDDDEREWERRVAAARAKARNDDTATIPQSGQAASVAAASSPPPDTTPDTSTATASDDEAEDEQEWERRVAAARARARNDDTASIPRADQAAATRAPTHSGETAAAAGARPTPPARISNDKPRVAAPAVKAPVHRSPQRIPRLAEGSTPRPVPTRSPHRPGPVRRPVAMVTPPSMRKPAERANGRPVAMVTPPTMRKTPPRSPAPAGRRPARGTPNDNARASERKPPPRSPAPRNQAAGPVKGPGPAHERHTSERPPDQG